MTVAKNFIWQSNDKPRIDVASMAAATMGVGILRNAKQQPPLHHCCYPKSSAANWDAVRHRWLFRIASARETHAYRRRRSSTAAISFTAGCAADGGDTVRSSQTPSVSLSIMTPSNFNSFTFMCDLHVSEASSRHFVFYTSIRMCHRKMHFQKFIPLSTYAGC